MPTSETPTSEAAVRPYHRVQGGGRANIQARVTEEDYARIADAADAEGLTVSAWLRNVAMEALDGS